MFVVVRERERESHRHEGGWELHAEFCMCLGSRDSLGVCMGYTEIVLCHVFFLKTII